MKKTTRCLSFLLAMIISLMGLAFNVQATGTGEITVQLSSSLGETTLALIRFFDYDESTDEFLANTLSKLYVRQHLSEGFTDDNIVSKVSAMNSSELASFAKSVEEFIKSAPVLSRQFQTDTVVPNGGSKTVKNMEYGYYVILDITAGRINPATVALTQATGAATVKIKGENQSIEKFIVEPDDNTKTSKLDGYSIGDIITFRVVGKVPDMTAYKAQGNYKYILKDTMATGLDFIDISSVTIGDTYTVPTSDYTLDTNTTDGTTFSLSLDKLYDGLENGSYVSGNKIVIEYTARLNETVTTGTLYENKAVLVYSNNPDNYLKTTETEPSKTNVYTYAFSLTKKTGLDDNATTLAGATFYLTNENNKYIEFKKITDTSTGEVTYKPTGTLYPNDGSDVSTYDPTTYTAPAEHTDYCLLISGNEKADATVDQKAKYYLLGLKAGDYTLIEKDAPDGYQIKSGGYKFTISESYTDADVLDSITLNPKADSENWIALTDAKNGILSITVVDIETGAVKPPLPETGGIGTTIFTIAGIFIMASAIGIFVFRKREI